ncbi:hypothetical protein BJY00DRAFT_292691 [Aspergillus carlsbadensis]|nr:hypothetical protein BJY00DRAFT_292691 [Aspergillus carlsbadensis]
MLLLVGAFSMAGAWADDAVAWLVTILGLAHGRAVLARDRRLVTPSQLQMGFSCCIPNELGVQRRIEPELDAARLATPTNKQDLSQTMHSDRLQGSCPCGWASHVLFPPSRVRCCHPHRYRQTPSQSVHSIWHV